MNLDSLWGDEFTLPSNENKTKKILDKISKPKEVKIVKEKVIKSKKISVEEKLSIVKDEVYRILGKQLDNVEVIYSRERFHEYIDTAISNKIIAVDTETNNSLDPLTCKLMGLCLYTPNLKAAYIPVNHINKDTEEKLPQLTEEDIHQELSRLISDVKIIMHNGKFDYQVIKCTCNVCLNIDWDTMIGAKLLDENGLKGDYSLKKLYIRHIDPEQEKYDIENLFEHLEYAIVDPELFALYAATDALMTYKLYEYQLSEFTKPESEALYNCALLLEMPMVKVIGEMELAGMEVDQEYTDLLSKKFHKRLDAIDKDIYNELNLLKPQIEAWRLTEDANLKPKKKTGEGEGKSKSEQLEDPINLASPTQLAILFYDILKCPCVSKKAPRGTGEEQLLALAEKSDLNIFKLLLKRRECVKLLTTYIDTIPELAKRWPDGRVRTHFNQYGAATGRLSSSDPLNF